MSFCTDSDSLPMWNYYANGGCCLHFNKEYLKSFFHNDLEFFYYDDAVIYNENEKKQIIRDIISNAIKQDNYVQRIGDDLNLKKYFFKNKAFEYENEYRIIIGVPQDQINPTFRTDFKNKNGYIVPYIQIEIDGNEKNNYDWHTQMFLIKGITVSPFFNERYACKGIRKFIEKNGYLFMDNIQYSKIPIRF